jgi:hypothetical protein
VELAGGVERLHALGQLAQRRAEPVEVGRAARTRVRDDVDAAHQLHREEHLAVLGRHELVQANEVRMVHAGERPELALEVIERGRAEMAQPLDGHHDPALGVHGFVDGADRAGADAASYAIALGPFPVSDAPRRRLCRLRLDVTDHFCADQWPGTMTLTQRSGATNPWATRLARDASISALPSSPPSSSPRRWRTGSA